MQVKEKILITDNLTTGYVIDKQTIEVSCLLSLHIMSGQLVALIGPNGSGKSTLLRTLSGLQPNLKGEVIVSNNNISNISGKDRAKLLSLVLTDKININNLLVKDLVEIGRYPYTGSLGILSKNDHAIITKSLQMCSLANYHSRIFSQLSDGEKQRVMLARALAQDTPLMLLDEPTAHLDFPNRVAMLKMLLELKEKTNKAILFSTHDLDLALQWCDVIWLMNKEGFVRVGTPEDLVLSGAFSEVFENNGFYFDITRGVFKMKRDIIAKIELTGKGSIKEWTKRALERKGYIVDNDGVASILVESPNKWILRYMDKVVHCESIYELLMCIEKYNVK